MRYGAAEAWSLLKPTWRRGAAAMLEAFLASTVAMATPILYAALGELLVEQSGVINIGIEGAMLAGAFFALAAAYISGSLALGLLAGIAPAVALDAMLGPVLGNLAGSHGGARAAH